MVKKTNQPGPAEGAENPSGVAGPAKNQDPAAALQPSAAGHGPSASTPPQPSQNTGAGDAADATSAAPAGNDAAQPGGSKPAGQAAPSSGRGPASADLLKQVLEGYLHAATLQTDYQSLYRSLPAVVGIAAEIMKKKEAGDAAMTEGMQAVERVLEDARDKAEQMSKAMMAQQSALDQLLKDKATLTDLLKATQQKAAKATAPPHLGLEAAALADPKVAYQLNTLMGRFSSMISREVERKIADLLQSKAAQANSTKPKS